MKSTSSPPAPSSDPSSTPSVKPYIPTAKDLAPQIRAAFIRHKEIKIRKRYKPSGKPGQDTAAHWLKAAEVCIDLNAQPDVFVAAIFSQSTVKGGPFSSTLGGGFARQWYHEYCRIHGMKVGRPPQNPEAPEDEVGCCSSELDSYLKMMCITLFHATGSIDYQTPEAVEFLRSTVHDTDPMLRVLLGYPDPEIMRKFHRDAKEFLLKRPDFVQEARKLKLPVDAILKWQPNKNQ